LWYTAEVEVQEAAPVAELCVDARVGEAVEVEVGLSNTLDVPAVFKVLYAPETLLGPSTCTLKPQEQATFAFYFAPLLPTVSTGHVTFSHEEVCYLSHLPFMCTSCTLWCSSNFEANKIVYTSDCT
jgi:hypothetical protein